MDKRKKQKGDFDMDVIETKGLSKDYGHGRGIFDVTFEVHKGEVYGFLGPNGAGKSTTMRHLMGFSRPKSGDAYIGGKDCWKDHAAIMKSVGYLPGEVALPDGLNGVQFLKMMKGLRGGRGERMQEMIDLFQVNLNGSVKKNEYRRKAEAGGCGRVYERSGYPALR